MKAALAVALLVTGQIRVDSADGLSVHLSVARGGVSVTIAGGGGVSDPLYAAAGSTPALDLNFEARGDLVDAISGNALGVFSRLSAGTYLDSDGLIKNASADTPRFEHDKDGQRVGLLFENISTNYVLYSEDFSGAAWTLNGASLSPNAAMAPDGAMTADKLIASGSAGTLQNRVYQQINTGTYTRSVFAKAAEADEILFRTADGFTSGSYIVFSLVDGSIVSQSGTAPLDVYVEEYPDGWWRFGVSSNGVSLIYFAVFGANCQAGNGIYIWGANATSYTYNARIITSYIKTDASTVTRSADTYYISGANFASYFNNGGPGTKYMDFDIHMVNTAGGAVREKNGNLLTYEFRNGYASVVNSSIQAQFNFTGASYGDREKWSLAYATNDFAGSRNGAAALTDAIGSLPSVVELRFEETVGVIRRYAYWNTRIANANLEAMTAP